MEQVEREAKSGSVLEQMKSKSKMFVEVLKEEGIVLDDIIVFYMGKNGEDIARAMEEMNLFFVEIEEKSENILEIEFCLA